jgi:hypothetical protein
MRRLSPVTLAGVASGVLFYLNALIPYSHAWPLVWPVAGGAAAVVLAARRHGERQGALGTGARAGAVAVAVFFVATVPTLFLLSRPGMARVGPLLGGNGPLVMTGSMLLALAAAGAFGIPVGALGALAAHPFARARAF